MVYSIKNIKFLDLISIQTTTQTQSTNAFEILRKLKQLLVIKLDLTEPLYPITKEFQEIQIRTMK